VFRLLSFGGGCFDIFGLVMGSIPGSVFVVVCVFI
jgi:hypothetical protein